MGKIEPAPQGSVCSFTHKFRMKIGSFFESHRQNDIKSFTKLVCPERLSSHDSPPRDVGKLDIADLFRAVIQDNNNVISPVAVPVR